jgi:acetyl esterase/lipase
MKNAGSEKLLSNGLTRLEMVRKLQSEYQQPALEHTLPPDCETFKDIPYNTESPRQRLDIYKPKGEGPFPVVVNIHGGGWYTGDKADFSVPGRLKFLPYGYAVVSVGYRLMDTAVFPAQLEDVENGIAWIVEHGAEYHLDTLRMGIISGSAGTPLALTAALKSKAFRAASMNCSILDFSTMTRQFRQLNLERTPMFAIPDSDCSIESLLLGGAVQEMPELCREAAPRSYLDVDAPYIQLYHGLQDRTTPYLQSVDFAEEAARITGDPERVSCILLPDTGHSGGLYYSDEVFQQRLEFMEKHLKN